MNQQNIARDDAITTIHFPIRLLTVAVVLTTLTFAWFGWINFDAHRDAKTFTDRLSRIEELRGVIVHLDEVLTMSARMAAATGDSQWEKRYRHFEPQLDAAIKEQQNLEPPSTTAKPRPRRMKPISSWWKWKSPFSHGPGQGAVFTLELPSEPPKRESSEAEWIQPGFTLNHHG